MVSNSKKYFTALSITTVLKTNTKCSYPIDIPIFKKRSLQPTHTDPEKTGTRHEAGNGNITRFYFSDSAALYVFVLSTQSVLRGDAEKRVCLVYFLLSSLLHL